jgi:hypothetical protein
MGWLTGVLAWFKSLAARAFAAIQAAGLDDAVMELALDAVRRAEAEFSDNATRRESVVAFLTSKGIPEGVARAALEIALALVRKQTS